MAQYYAVRMVCASPFLSAHRTTGECNHPTIPTAAISHPMFASLSFNLRGLWPNFGFTWYSSAEYAHVGHIRPEEKYEWGISRPSVRLGATNCISCAPNPCGSVSNAVNAERSPTSSPRSLHDGNSVFGHLGSGIVKLTWKNIDRAATAQLLYHTRLGYFIATPFIEPRIVGVLSKYELQRRKVKSCLIILDR